MRDSQRQAVYDWGNRVARKFPGLDDPMTLEDCQALADKISADYGVHPPTITDGRGRRRAAYKSWRRQIPLPKWARTVYYVCHEMAHALNRASEAVHGPAFARIQLDLLVRYGKAPRGEVKAMGVHQKPRRVRFVKTAACPKPATAAYRKWVAKERELKKALKDHRVNLPR